MVATIFIYLLKSEVESGVDFRYLKSKIVNLHATIFYNNSRGSVNIPVTAAAAAINGLANNVLEPGP
ncbi:hypothetical protein SAMN05443669_101928 [Flavobacterium xanthum]|uniref:Uncharacterized protein n=1 Tax=Flavobacterium xanthum TaxID=69322 RepID=A0A1M7F4S4_9FLAO|nr:hypothetical protein SAMN05443669_101928 [Flavobacterium xanthum]